MTTTVDPAVETPATGGRTSAQRDHVTRLRTAVVCIALTALCFSQRGGLIGQDTKMDLVVDPGGFLLRALSLWDPDGAMGRIQNQAYGYLVPMGPFFAVADALAVPGWMAQRAWMALLLCTAYLGVLALCRELGLGSGLGCHLSGLAFALTPRVSTLLGTVSAELLPTVLLPWVLVPLVRGLRGGSSVRRCAAVSGVAVLLMGGANAASVVAVLVLPAVVLLWHVRSRAGRRLLAWWVLSVTLATAWWVAGLLLMGRYGLDFLPFTESSAATTRFASAGSAMRGTTHWVAYVVSGGQAWWPAGHAVALQVAPVLAASLLAGLGLLGLATWRSRWALPLLSSAVLGVLLLVAGHVATLPGPLAVDVAAALDGPLSPLRNTHKFDAVLRLPLVVGLAALAAASRRGVLSWTRAAVAIALVVLLTPALRGDLVPPGAYEDVPGYWREAADWLNDQPGRGAVLITPGAPFGEFVWGRPLDEPLQPLLHRPWVGRSAVVLGSTGLVRLADAVDHQVARGEPSRGLAEVLARSGVQFVVVRNDLDVGRTGAPPEQFPRAALEGSPGLVRAAEFGASDGEPPQVEVYEVTQPVQQAVALPMSDRLDLVGGPEALLSLANSGELQGRPVVVDDGVAPAAPEQAPLVVTDSARRQEVQFSRVRDNTSATLGRDEEPMRAGAVGLFAVDDVARRTTERWYGVQEIAVSSSSGDPGVALLRGPSRGGWAALDGQESTFWASNPSQDPVGQWIEVRLDRPVDLAGATVALAEGLLFAEATRIVVETDSGRSRQEVLAGTVPLHVPPGRTDRVRLTIDEVRRDGEGPSAGLVGIRELSLPGIRAERSLEVPATATEASWRPLPSVWRFARDSDRESCVRLADGPWCSTGMTSTSEELGQPLDRTFGVGRARSVPLSGTVTSESSTTTEQRLTPGGVVVSASSRRTAGPVLSPVNLLDGDATTSWVAADWDDLPTVSLLWNEERSVSQVHLVWSPSDQVARPSSVVVEAAGVRRVLPVAADGLIELPETSTNALRLELLGSGDPAATDRPVGLAEIRVPAFDDVVVERAADEPVLLPCGEGPVVVLNGMRLETEVFSTVGDLRDGRPANFRTCGGVPVRLDEGEHRVVVEDRWGWTTRSLALGGLPPAEGADRSVELEDWAGERRALRVGPGEAAVLALAQNAAEGWRAEVDGRLLEPLTIDGWRQGWVVPPGQGGVVEISYAPGRWFSAGLVVGGLAALVLLLLAGRPDRLTERPPARVATPPAVLVTAATLAAVWLAGGLWGLAAGVFALFGVAGMRESRWGRLAVPGLLLLSGVATVVGRRDGDLLPWTEAGSWLALAGVVWAVALLVRGPTAAVSSRRWPSVGLRR